MNQETKRKAFIAAVTIIAFVAFRNLKYFFAYVVFGKEVWNGMDFDLRISLINYTTIIAVLVVTIMLFKRKPFEILGLKKDFWKGLLYGFLFTIPMFIGYGFQAGFKTDITWLKAHMDLVLAGFFEEFFFRAFLFGILFFYAGWGFVSAVLIPSLFFGIGHLYQADTFSDGIGVFLFTTLGGAGFAWFYMVWRSIWMVAFLHGFMDLAWDMFAVQSNVTGNLYANIFRFITLGLAIYFSIQKAKAENTYSLKGKVWLNPNSLW